MTHITNFKELQDYQRYNNVRNIEYDNNNSINNQDSLSAAPVKLEINMNNTDGQFSQLLNFVEKVIKDKESNNLSNEAIDDLKNWFPFLKNNMTVYLNIDLYVNEEEKKDQDTKEKPVSSFPIKFPTPLPRSSAAGKPPIIEALKPDAEEINNKTGITPKKLFIPCIKKPIKLETNKLIQPSINKNNVNEKIDVELDNLYLSSLLKKRNMEQTDIIRTATHKSFKSDDLNEKMISNHILKVKSFWSGSNVNYPHSFKKKELILSHKNKESLIIESLDHSKKMIPTMFSEHHSMAWE